ncbi:MAG: N(4)-(beta-N-acetylglucosaminyl)-L-asparaginase [Gemmatimonadales bacterium]
MPDSVSRREFLAATGAVVAASGVPRPVAGFPAVHIRPPAKAVAVSSPNGFRGVQKAVDLVLAGTDTLDAAIEGVKIQELDPNDHSVGYGGLPNEEGVVQLDASCMHGPTRRAGAVGALEGIKVASEIARLVLKYTDHIMLVGEGAKKFALSYGYQEEELLTPEARQIWLTWRANRGPKDDWLDVPDGTPMVHRPTGTINMNVVNAKGEISSVTTTAGLAFKIPGRVGDSPIIGAGQYTDNDVGAAGSTGLGELNIVACGAFYTVDCMRRGLKPTDAALETLKRVLQLAPPRLIGADGKPKFQLNYYVVNKNGEHGSAALYPSQYAVNDGSGAKLKDAAHLFEGGAP